MKLIIMVITTTLALSSFAGSGGLAGGSKSGTESNIVKKFFGQFLKRSDRLKLNVDVNSTWNEILDEARTNYDVKVESTVFIGQPISAFDACIDGDMLKTTKKFNVYKRKYVGRQHDSDSDKDGYMRVVVGQKFLTFPITYQSTKEVCRAHDKNCKWVPVTIEQDLVKSVPIKKVTGRDGERNKIYTKIFEKDYYIPNCM